MMLVRRIAIFTGLIMRDCDPASVSLSATKNAVQPNPLARSDRHESRRPIWSAFT
jgi:hypothetical protein